MEKEEKKADLERKAQNYSLEYKNWTFKIDELDSWGFYVNIKYRDKSWIYFNTNAKTIEEAKERVENFIKTELK